VALSKDPFGIFASRADRVFLKTLFL